jgi:hypothetical protein
MYYNVHYEKEKIEIFYIILTLIIDIKNKKAFFILHVHAYIIFF